MHCPNCGKELNGSEKFCGGCGNDLTHLVYTSAPAAGSAPGIPAPIVEPASAPVAPVVPVTPVTPVAEVTSEPVVAAPVEPAPAPIPEPIPEPAPVVEPVVEAAPVEAAVPAAPAPAPAPAPVEAAVPAAAPAPAPAPAPVGAAPVQSAFGDAAPIAPAAQPAATTEAPKKKKKGVLGLIIGLTAAGLVIIVGAIIAVAVFINNKTEETERTKRTTEDETETTVTEPVSELAERTIMVYAIGTDLESTASCLSADVKEMMAATPNSDLNLVLQVGGCTDFRNNYMTDGITQRFSIANGNIEKLSDLGDVSMVEPETLEDFVKFSKENYPAEKYILVLWDHGGGVPLGFGYDEIHDGTLTEIEMAQAIGNCDIEFESIIFNACLMGSLEVAKALDPYTEYIIAAESPTWGSAYYDIGINYTNFLNYIGPDFNGTAKDYGEFIVRDYMDTVETTQQTTGYFGIDTCMSAIDTDNINEVFEAYEAFIAALDTRVFTTEGYIEFVQLRDDCGSFESTDSVDLTTLANKYINCGDANIERAASKLVNEVGNCVFTESNNSYTYAHGMTTYSPYLYPQYYDEARLTFVTLGYSDTTIQFYDKFVSKELYILQATNYAGDWYVQPADANSIESGNVYDISSLVVDMGEYEAITLTEEDWKIIREVKVTLAIIDPDEQDKIYYFGTDDQYTVDSNGYIILENPINWVYFKNFGFVTCECLKYEVADDGKWYKYIGAEALVNGQTSYVVIAFSSDDKDGTIIGYYNADIINDTYDVNQGSQFTENDQIIFVKEYYDGNTQTMEYSELGDAVSYEKALELYNYSTVNYDDVECYIAFDLYDVYNNDYYLPLRPGKPAYEINVERGDNGYSNGGNYDEGTLDATTMLGFVVTYDSSNAVGAADDIEWVFEDGTFSDDCIYPSGTSTISLVAYTSEYSDEEFEFEFYYSPDTMFSDRELQADVYSGVATCVEEGEGYAYHFDYTGGVQPGYYIITVNLKGANNRTIISVCQVE
ncbi:MAG: hypothetical protein E7383_01490 [Ruminococcaceae bacterium]|nr:hypothetical protein [Oscillospiraceae bacterium]